MNKRLNSQRQTSELMHGFEESEETRSLDLTTNENEKGSFM